MTFAGIPATIALSGTSLLTNDKAPIKALFPILTLPNIIELAPTYTQLFKIGAPPSFPAKVTFCAIMQFLPTTALLFMTTPIPPCPRVVPPPQFL